LAADEALRPLPNSDPDARALRVQTAVARGDHEATKALLREGPTNHARLNYLRGRLALQGNEPRKAAEFFRATLRQDPSDRDAIQGLGVALRTLDDPQFESLLQLAALHDRLKRTIKESVTTLKTDEKIFYKLGAICESLKRLDEARAWYRLAITRDPLDDDAQKKLTLLEKAAP
jgi:Flp pilus assembly protein TadD